jgi:hypothetical protein
MLQSTATFQPLHSSNEQYLCDKISTEMGLSQPN